MVVDVGGDHVGQGTQFATDVDGPRHRHLGDHRSHQRGPDQIADRIGAIDARGRDAAVVPFSVLQQRRIVRVSVGGHNLVVRWRGGVASALDSGSIARGRDVGAASVIEHGKPVVFDEPFWFAVAAFLPHVRIVR